MTMTAAIDGRTAQTGHRANASRIAAVDIVADLGKAEAIWRELESQHGSHTPYQRFDFLAPWQHHVGEREGASTLVIVARDAERRPLALLPLACFRNYGVNVASFMGGKHSTFNMALWDRDFAIAATPADMTALVAEIAEHGNVDVLALHQQPLTWRELQNPLALLPHQPSVNGCPLLVMEPGAEPAARISNSFRRRLKGKERKLQPGPRYYIATEDADITRLLDWFFQVKPLRMAEQKLPNVFAEPGVEEFIRAACLARLDGGGGGRVIDIHALECDAEVIAIFAGVADGHRFSMMFNTYTMSGNAKYSPGLILMRDIIDHYAAAGYRALDLGIGSDDYKRLFCKDDEPIFDSFIPLTARGRVAAAAMSGLNRAKRQVKHNPALLEMVQKLRGTLR
ncbi:MAG: GNAT family N-acetyltransferase [Bradyrhizobium sp.]|uniref:GNAT family N-acetyltransferase n=1 Tax=Bradyrhizobium sp. TaxID=376 RepID=UPI003D0DC77E